MEKDSFIFYRSFYEAVEGLEDVDRLAVLDAICKYALNQKETELQPVPKALFTLVKPQLEANHKKFINGSKGGRPKTKTKPKDNLTKTKPKPNVNVNVNANVNKEGFDKFWNEYDYKKSRSNAEKSFAAAIKKESLDKIISGVVEYKKHRGADKQYWKHPATWLNQECWNDEYSPKEETQFSWQQEGFVGSKFTR